MNSLAEGAHREPRTELTNLIRSIREQSYENFRTEKISELKEDRSDAEAGDERQKLVGRQCFGEVREDRKGLS